MSNEIKRNEKDKNGGAAPRRNLLPLPGVAAISLYLLLLSGVIIVGVAASHYYPPLYLVFAAGFIAAAAGLLLLLRWAWAMALGAVFLLVVYDLWIFGLQRELPALVQGLLNLVFFLYLIRAEVRNKLR
jgi:glycerol-3-phosphate acyltransferase PlsY